MEKKIAFILCPPLWAILPSPGIAYLAEEVEAAGGEAWVYDINAEIYKLAGKDLQQDWTVNRDYIKKTFYHYCRKNFPGIFESLTRALKNEGIRTIGFSVFKSNRAFSFALAEWLKKKLPGIRIIFGGPETFNIDLTGDIRFDIVDHYVVGEGELPLQRLISGCKDKIFRFKQKLHLAGYPRYGAFDLSLYKKRMPIVAGRGCLNRCTFCSERLLFKRYRFRKAEDIFEEINYHYTGRNIRHFTFYDSLFNGRLPALERLLDLIIESPLNICWEAQIAVQPGMSNTLLGKLKRSGCINLFIGLESGSDAILGLMNKPFTTKEAVTFMERLSRAGLQYEVSLITHFPGETEVEFVETILFLKANKILIKKIAQVSSFKSYPGIQVSLPEGYGEAGGPGKIKRIVKLLEDEKIPYTPSYINNLI